MKTATVFSALLGFLLLCLPAAPWAQPPSAAPTADTPVASGSGEVARLLLKWYAEGTAAGNLGDYYDNRDRNHSPLGMGRHPQLQKVAYTPEQVERREDYGLQKVVRPHVTVGNSSTSDAPERTGSIPRSYYASPQGLPFLMTQYVRGNLYVYPEHRDHDPGRNGQGGGYGDTYPANTPYLIVSQGSSGSDQPFLSAVVYTLAAFRPEVKRRLVEKGLLMPAVQMILRSTSRRLSRPEDYLTGKAHPTAFDGKQLDPLAMVNMAHEMTLDTLPPLALMTVREETRTVAGRDFFEPAGVEGEALGDTPFVIARVFRGVEYRRRMIVSVSRDGDLNRRPLTYHWAVLRGDPERVRIRNLVDDGSTAVLTVAYHPRRPVSPGADLDSNRVDIGVFTHNGARYSPPSFVTFFFIDSESRTYGDDHRILEVGYGAGSPRLEVADWSRLFAQLGEGASPFAERFLKPRFTPEQASVLGTAAGEYAAAAAAEKAALESREAAGKRARELSARLEEAGKGPGAAEGLETALKAAREAHREAGRHYDRARGATEEVLTARRPGMGFSVHDAVTGALETIVEDPRFLSGRLGVLDAAYRAAEPPARRAFDRERERLVATGVIAGLPGRAVKLKPALAVDDDDTARLTVFEKKMLSRLTATALAELLLPGTLENRPARDLVDRRIAAPKFWRDLYRYDDSGVMTGWTRYAKKRVFHFNADGLMITERDGLGRCVQAKRVRYDWDPVVRDADGRFKGFSSELLEFGAAGEAIHYGYDGPGDVRGHVIPDPE